MLYDCTEVIVEPRDREEVREFLTNVFRKMSPYWAARFERLKGRRSLLLNPGNEYVIISEHAGDESGGGKNIENPFVVIGKMDVGECKLLYPVVVNWSYVEKTRSDHSLYEKVQSAILVGVGKIVLPIEWKKVLAIFDWTSSAENVYSVLRETIEECFENDLKEDERKIFEFFDEKRDPVLLYLESRLGSSVLQTLKGAFLESEEDGDGISVRWGFDGDVYVNVKSKVTEQDRNVLSGYKQESLRAKKELRT